MFWLQIVFEHTKDTYLVHICSIGARKIENLIFCQHSSTEHTATTSQRRIISIESTSELWIGHFAVGQFQPSIAFASSSLSTHHCEIQIRGAMMHTRDKQRWCIALLVLGDVIDAQEMGWGEWVEIFIQCPPNTHAISRIVFGLLLLSYAYGDLVLFRHGAIIPFSTPFGIFFFSLFLSFSSYSVFCMFDALARLAAFAMHASVYIIFFMLHNNHDFSHSQRTADVATRQCKCQSTKGRTLHAMYIFLLSYMHNMHDMQKRVWLFLRWFSIFFVYLLRTPSVGWEFNASTLHTCVSIVGHLAFVRCIWGDNRLLLSSSTALSYCVLHIFPLIERWWQRWWTLRGHYCK